MTITQNHITTISELKEEKEAVQHFIDQLRYKRSHPALPPLDRNEKDRLKQLYKERKELRHRIKQARELKRRRN